MNGLDGVWLCRVVGGCVVKYQCETEVVTEDGYPTGCLQLLEILEISWNLNGPPGNFCVMIENFISWLMALLHDDVALFVH